MSGRRLDASGLLDWAHAAVGGLVVHAEEINRLNVFPVADADTGTNMLFTMRAALAEAERHAKRSGDVSQVAAALARGALRGARGNSGVILSQILRGLADVTASASADTDSHLADVDAVLFGAALRHGVALAVGSMGEEVAGTIVSVLQAAAARAEHCADDGDDLASTVLSAAEAAVTALERTPEQLGVLAEFGVVDAGGRGLVVLLDALAATLTGHTPARGEYVPSPPVQDATEPSADVRPPHYEVMYQISATGQRLDALRERLEELGDSVAIAGDGGDRYSVHVHADDAGAAIEAGLAVGTPSQIQISTLHGAVMHSRWTRRRVVLAVVDGDGAEQLFTSEGAHVLRCADDRPDPSASISAKELLRAVVDTGAGQVVVLPNGFVAAEELVAGCAAATGWGLSVVPVPTGSMVQGLAALAVHEPGRAVVDDGYSMTRAAGATRHASVRVADEEALTFAGPCEPGDGLGIAGDEVLVVRHDIAATARRLLDLLLGAGGELVTVLVGAGVDDWVGEDLQAHVHRHHPGTELVTYKTGHRGDALLIGVE
ncbi:MAG TPA: DAK2 domain-containing protein [Mycobacterium sp.]